MSAARSHKPLPVAEWPRTDRDAWSKATAAGDEFSDSGIAARWAPRTQQNAELAYGRLLGFLRGKRRLKPVRRVGERLVPDNLCRLGYELSSQLAPYTVLGIFASLGVAFKAMDPAADRRVLNTSISRLAQAVKSTRDISGNLLSPRELVAIGRSIMEEAEKQTRHSWRSASLYRDGLLTMFMALCPLRPGAVSEMQIGIHLIVEGGSVTVQLPPAERKKRRPEDVPFTDELARRFLRYLTHYRPMFPAPVPEHAQALWLSRNGLPLDRDKLSRRIKERIGSRSGKRFTAHMFRHPCATYIVDVAPERALMIAGVLGHAGFRTAQRHYIKGQQHMALIKYQEAVRHLTRRGRSKLHDRAEVGRDGRVAPARPKATAGPHQPRT
jgi:integrase